MALLIFFPSNVHSCPLLMVLTESQRHEQQGAHCCCQAEALAINTQALGSLVSISFLPLISLSHSVALSHFLTTVRHLPFFDAFFYYIMSSVI